MEVEVEAEEEEEEERRRRRRRRRTRKRRRKISNDKVAGIFHRRVGSSHQCIVIIQFHSVSLTCPQRNCVLPSFIRLKR